MSKYGAPFRSFLAFANGPANVLDELSTIVTPGSSAWTFGAGIVDSISLPVRSTSSQWNVQGITITGQLVYADNSDATHPKFGKLGQILCGLSIQGPQTTPQSGQPWNLLPSTPLPRDGTLLATLWDPSSDPLPPAVAASVNATLPVSASAVPPEPLTVPAGGSIYAGIWIIPSLLNTSATGLPIISLAVLNAQYELIYDDAGMGQGPTPPPYGM